MAKLNDLIVTIGAQTKQFDKALGSSMKKMQRFGMNTKKLGKSMTMGLTAPIAALGFTAVKAFDQQAKAIAQVEAGLKSTGATVGYTSKQLQQMASDLQTKTIFGDEEILKDATSQLLTFTNIAGDQFARTQSVALDLATRLDGDLKSASIQLGKALNDPIANLSALSRSGIQFSEDQKQVIKSLTESGRLAEAQTVILDELEKQYGGSAEAAAKAGTGGLKQLANSFGDLQEEFGKIIMEFLPPVIDGLKNMLATFQNLSPAVKRFMVIGAGIAAALGPLLIILPSLLKGFMLLGSFVGKTLPKQLMKMWGAMTSPIGLVVLAIAGLVAAFFYFWDDVKKPLANAINAIISMYNESEGLRIAVAVFKQAFVAAFTIVKRQVLNVVDAFALLFKAIKTAFTDGFAAAGDVLTEGFKTIVEDTAKAGADVYDGFVEAIEDAKTKDPVEFVTTEDLDKTKDKVVGFFSNLIPDLNFNASDGGGGGGAGATVTPTPTETVTVQADLEFEDIEFIDDADLDEEDIDKVIERTNLVKNQINSIAGSMANFIDSTFKSIIAGTATFEEVMRDMIKQMLIQLASLIAQFAILSVLMPSSLVGKGGNVMSLGKFIGGGFGIPQMASGGIVSGPVIAQVGEYAGAQHNPEVIAPLDKLQAMMGGQSVQVTGKISGRDILLTSERNAIDRNRVRGF